MLTLFFICVHDNLWPVIHQIMIRALISIVNLSLKCLEILTYKSIYLLYIADERFKPVSLTLTLLALTYKIFCCFLPFYIR